MAYKDSLAVLNYSKLKTNCMLAVNFCTIFSVHITYKKIRNAANQQLDLNSQLLN